MSATSHPPRDRAALLARIGELAWDIAILHDDAARLGMPQAVTMGLLWLRDDAITVYADANTATHPEPAL